MLWLLLVIYVISGLTWYLNVRLLYVYKYEYSSPSTFDLVAIFIPVLNTLWSVFATVDLLLVLTKKKFNLQFSEQTLIKFFGIKR